MNDKPDAKKERGFAVKLLLFMSVLIFITIGGYSLYKIVAQKSNISDNKIAETSKPTENINNLTGNNPADQSPTPNITETITITKTPTEQPTNKIFSPSITPTKIPTPTATVKPINTPSPTKTPTPIIQASSTPTRTPQNNLPVSGNSNPTVLLFFLGIIFILPIIYLH